ncbi:MAG TPA: hypothetical protein VMT17_12225 [Anaeromyxobacteraceae bacterium]|nr:hypothetical protein [Anaeromyxobacteraceae bacterium]
MLPGPELVVALVLDKARERLRARFPTDSARIERASLEMLDHTVAAIEEAFQQYGPERTNAGARSEGRLASKLDDHEIAAVVMRLFPEAVTATTEERRAMLAHALAGLLQPDLDSETRSRVCRAVTQLEPRDVRELRKLERTSRGGPDAHPPPTMTPSLEPLRLAGCISGEGLQDRPGSVTLTVVGRALLATLPGWAVTSA